MRLEYVEPVGEVDSEGDTITDGWTAVCGPGADRVAGSADSTRFELVTSGGHQLQPVVRPGKLGQFARRHYWLAPRSDDAVGAGFGLRQGAAGLQQLNIG